MDILHWEAMHFVTVEAAILNTRETPKFTGRNPVWRLRAVDKRYLRWGWKGVGRRSCESS